MLTKIQYNNYEPGEFSGEADRTFDQTVQLIESFPWEEQRDHLQVSLTNPSITINDLDGNFLKLATWYHGKFILYFFNADKHLFTRPFDNFRDAIPVIETFFEMAPFDTTGFHRESTLLTFPASHFRANDFRYSVTVGRILFTTAPLLLLLCVLSVMIPIAIVVPGNFYISLFFTVPFWAFIFGYVLLFVNHYRACAGKLLIVSKGKDEFHFGTSGSLHSYRKQDITEIVTYGRQGKGGYGWQTRVGISFTGGSSIDISCLMIEYLTLIGKFPTIKSIEMPQWYPFIPRVVSVLSE